MLSDKALVSDCRCFVLGCVIEFLLVLGIVSPGLETLAIPRITHLFTGSDQELGVAALYAIQPSHYPTVPATLLRLPLAKGRGVFFCSFPTDRWFNKRNVR